MTNLKILLKNYWLMFLGRLAKNRKKASFTSSGVILLLSGLIFIWMFASLTYTTIDLYPDTPEMAISSLASMMCIFVLMMIVLKGTNQRVGNDYEILGSLPIKRSTIVLSKIIKDYVFDLATLLLTLLPGVVTYCVCIKDASKIMIMNAVILSLFLTLLCNAASIIISSLINFITKNFRNAEVIQSVINTCLIICFILFYLYFNFTLTYGSLSEDIINLYPIKLISDFIFKISFKGLYQIVLWCVVPFVIAVAIRTSSYGKKEKRNTKVSQELNFKCQNVTKDLFVIEAGRYSRSTVYVINTIFGGLFAVLFAIILVSPNGSNLINGFFNMVLKMSGEYNNDAIGIVIIIFISVISSATITTSASISMEGKSFWILKANPINPKNILDAKILFNIVVGGIPALISSTIICFGLHFSPEYWILIYLIPLLALTFSSCMGLIANVRNYNLEWQDETEVIKKSMSVLIALLLATVPGLFVLIMYFMVFINLISPFAFLIIVVGFYLLVDVLIYLWIMKKGVKEFESIC